MPGNSTVGQPRWSMPIGIKILALTASILISLGVLAYFSYQRLSRVDDELVDISEYILPVRNLVAEVNVHALEQQLHWQRVLTFYELRPLPRDEIDREVALFTERGRRVDEELSEAVRTATAATERGLEQRDREAFAALVPMLRRIESEHQDVQDHSAEVIGNLANGRRGDLHKREADVEEEADHFDEHLEKTLEALDDFVVTAEAAAEHHENRLLQLSLAVTGAATLGGILFASIMTIGLIRPLRRLTSSAKAVMLGNLDVRAETTSGDEVGALAHAFNSMVGELRQREKIRNIFGKYVDPRVVEHLIDDVKELAPAGQKQEMTVLFSDIVGFQRIAETLPPDDLVALLNRYLTLISTPTSEHHGVIDKFVGTAVMSFWGPPLTSPADHARLACCTALDQLGRLAELRRLVHEATRDDRAVNVDLCIGIATGPLVVGTVGSATSKTYTVTGDIVNTAARLKGASKQYGIRVMMTKATQQLVADAFETREVDRIQVMGIETPIEVFELLAPTGELDPRIAELRTSFHQGLHAYRRRDWEQALRCFEACLRINADDGPAQVFEKRVHELRSNPPPEDWQGLWRLTKK